MSKCHTIKPVINKPRREKIGLRLTSQTDVADRGSRATTLGLPKCSASKAIGTGKRDSHFKSRRMRIVVMRKI